MTSLIVFSVLLLYHMSTVSSDMTWYEVTAARTVPQNKTFPPLQFNLKPYSQLFEYFKAKYEKVYSSEEENSLRRIIFGQNARFIEKHNYRYLIGQKSFTVAINEFADMTLEEFNGKMKGFKMGLQNTFSSVNQSKWATFLTPNNVNLPSRIDWREHGYVTGVKNQHHCGSCWAFSTTGTLEGQHFRKTGRLVSLSEQQLLDCTHDYGEGGCKGGIVDWAFQYIRAKGGIESEADYPYNALEGTCKYDVKKEVATVAGFVNVQRGNETDLQLAVGTVGPVSIAIDASHPSFQFYSAGVYYEPACSSTELDHAVLAVGYGVEPFKYWLVKNSWGEAWGDNGYIKMSRDSNNQCGIATEATYPLV